MRPWFWIYALLHLVFALPTSASILVKSSLPRLEIWNDLSEKEKNFAYRLHRASKFGADILYFQNHRHALSIKSFLESALSQNNLRSLKRFYGSSEKGRERFEEFLAYSARFYNQAGPYTLQNQKIVLEKTNFKEIKTLFKRYVPRANQYRIDEIAKLMTDEEFEPIKIARSSSPTLDRPLTTQARAPIGPALQRVVNELTAAVAFALTDEQEAQLKSFVSQLTGTTAHTDVPLVMSTDSRVNFIMGFSESKWQSCLQIKGFDEPWGKTLASRCEKSQVAEVLDQPWTINAELELFVRGNPSLEGSAPYWTE